MRVLTNINRCHNHFDDPFFNVLICKMYAIFFSSMFFFFVEGGYISSHGKNNLFIVHNKNRYFLLNLLKFLYENSMVTLFNICMFQVNLILHFYKMWRQQHFFRKQNIAPSNPLKATEKWPLLSIKKNNFIFDQRF